MQFCTPNLVARLSQEAADIDRVEAVRRRAFGMGQSDLDDYDQNCQHVLVESRQTRQVLGCLRLHPFASGPQIFSSYSARYYDLKRLSLYPKPMLELGRFCVVSGAQSPDIIRLIWAMVAGQVQHRAVGIIFGCTSFPGTSPIRHQSAFDILGAHHLAPARWMPGVQAPSAIHLLPGERQAQDGRKGVKNMPTLMRSYLSLGGWVSDHGVIDRQLDTIHVFTGVEVAKIPTKRARRLYQMAA